MECLGTDPAVKSFLGLVWKKRGDVALTDGRTEHALAAYTEARHAFAEQNAGGQEATVAFLAGGVALELLQYELALQQYRDAASRWKAPEAALPARVGELSALTALHRTEESLERCRELGEAIVGAHLPRRQKRELLLRVSEKEFHNYALRGDLAKATEVLQTCLPIAPLEEQACHYATLAEWFFALGQAERSAAHAEEAQNLCRRMGKELPGVLLSVSRLELMRGNVHASEQRLFEAQVELPGGSPAGGNLDCDLHQTSLHLAKGELDLAEELAHRLRERLSLCDPKPLACASVLNTLGAISQLRGSLDEAESLHREALGIAALLHAPLEHARSLSSLADTEASRSSDGGEALAYLGEATAIVSRCGLKLVEHAFLVQRETIACRAADDVDLALERLSELLRTGYKFQSTALDLQTLLSLGVLNWQRLEEPSTALSYLDDAVEIAGASGQRLCEILARGLRGGVLQDLGETREAKDALEQVLREMEDLGLDIAARHEFGELYHDLGGLWFPGLR
jgi:tetratricopeptide (TPR) repeat protein